MNQTVRWPNPNQTISSSTQFFWRRIFDDDPLTAFLFQPNVRFIRDP